MTKKYYVSFMYIVYASFMYIVNVVLCTLLM
jgi:hypothetical protein